jgi:hypothetical protein
MSHPDHCYDPDNSYEDDMNYDDYNDFYADEDTAGYHPDADHELSTHSNDIELDDNEDYYDENDDSMDGDFDSAMRDAGFGTDEDYNCFNGEDY